MRILVIGYGNTLRCDDGAGPKVAEAVQALNLGEVRTIVCHQLSPELAEPVSRADLAVFVDAAVDGSAEVRYRPLRPCATAPIMAHAPNPQAVLALARTVFGRAPRGWWLTVPAVNLGFGEELSDPAKRGVEAAVEKIRALCAETAGAPA
jgi:hydrogenase maturation protease